MSDERGVMRGRMPRRNAIVLASLLGALVFTSVLLLTLAPSPLAPDAARRLFALDQPEALNPTAPLQPGRWSSIYIHHSKTRSGDAGNVMRGGMGDHFLIGNGQGCEDGEIQVGYRWLRQQPANLPLEQFAALSRSADRCIAICLVGDLDRTPPTAAQLQQLEKLVQTLQRKLNIPGQAVLAFDQPENALGIGRRFPTREFAQRLLP